MKLKYFAILWIIICGWGALALAQTESKPVLLMGGGYGKYDRQWLIKDIIEPNGLTFEDGGDFTSAEIWGNYSLVVVSGGFPALSAREIGWIQDYVKNGGKLLLTGPALASLRGLAPADLDWLGASGSHVVRDGDFAVADAGKTLASDTATAQAIFGLTTSYAPLKLTTAQALITRGGAPVAFVNRYGKGEVWFAGMEYFRILNSEKLAAKKLTAAKPARDFLEKLILQSGAQKKDDQIAAGLTALGAYAPVVWRRDFDFARGADFAAPPYPQKGEGLQQIHLDLGRNEWESTPFYLSSASADDHFTVTLSDLVAADAASKISASAIRLRVQGLAAPQLTVGPFWLLDVPRHDAPGKSTFEVPLKANDSATLWLTLNTIHIPAGEYHGTISFSNPAVKPVDFQIKVWPVNLPGREYFQTEATYNWTSVNGKFTDAPGDMARFQKHINDLAAHHVDYNEDGSWLSNYGGSVSLKYARLRGTNVGLEDALKQGLIKENALPDLDFSYFDPFVEKALLAGMPYFRFDFKNYPQDWLSYARAITGDKNLAADSPRHLAVKRWLLGQIVQYLHSKGITNIVSFIADEIDPDKIPDVLERAKLMHEFGIHVEFTATGQTGQKREYISALNPAIDHWIWNTVILPQAKEIVKTNSPIDPTDEQWNYVADWHRAPYVFNRTRGDFCAYEQLDGLFIHGYLRWYPNGGAVFNAPDGPIDTEGWEGARDGIEDARYWKRAQFLLNAAKQRPGLSAEAAKIAQQMAGWVSPDADALVQLKDASYSIYHYQNPQSSYEHLLALKRQLLESLVWLQQNVPTAYSLNYAGLKLVDAGKPQVRFTGDAAAAAALNNVLAARSLPQISGQTTGNIQVAFGTPEELKGRLGGDFLAAAHPRTGSYQVIVKGNTIAVVGGDATGTREGAQVLGQVIDATEIVTP